MNTAAQKSQAEITPDSICKDIDAIILSIATEDKKGIINDILYHKIGTKNPSLQNSPLYCSVGEYGYIIKGLKDNSNTSSDESFYINMLSGLRNLLSSYLYTDRVTGENLSDLRNGIISGIAQFKDGFQKLSDGIQKNWNVIRDEKNRLIEQGLDNKYEEYAENANINIFNDMNEWVQNNKSFSFEEYEQEFNKLLPTYSVDKVNDYLLPEQYEGSYIDLKMQELIKMCTKMEFKIDEYIKNIQKQIEPIKRS